MCVVREDEDSSKLPDLTMCGLKVGPACQQQLGRRSRRGLLKSQRSTTLEEREAFNPSIWKMEGAEKPSKREAKCGDSYGGGNALQNGNKKLRASVSESDESKKIQKRGMHASYKLMKPKRRRLEPTLPKDHDDHRAERGYNSISH